jgi:hypothetical protein
MIRGARSRPPQGSLTFDRNCQRRLLPSGAMEVSMPLMYLPLIMYVGWMQSILQPFDAMRAPSDRES